MGTPSGRGIQPGDRIGRYEVQGALGRGAMGMVYRARDTVLGREVAIKVMVAHFTDDAELRARFEREARVIARLKHPNIVVLHDIGYETDGSPFLAMELLRGETLEAILRHRERPPFEWNVSVVLQVLAGLAHAHRAGVVHRDIKPANVFVTEEGTAKLMDFGVARVTTTSTLSATGSIVGTADYMSPEQARGGRVDGRSDVFSLGSMLFELATRLKPFRSDNLMGTLYRIAHDEPELSAVAAQPGADRLVPVLARALSKPIEERFQTAEEFAAALREAFPGAASAPIGTSVSGAVAAMDGVPADAAPTGQVTADLRPEPPATGPTVELRESGTDDGIASVEATRDDRPGPERRAPEPATSATTSPPGAPTLTTSLTTRRAALAGVAAVAVTVAVLWSRGTWRTDGTPPSPAATLTPPSPVTSAPPETRPVAPSPESATTRPSPVVSPRPRAGGGSPRVASPAAIATSGAVQTLPTTLPPPASPSPETAASTPPRVEIASGPASPEAGVVTAAPAVYDADRLPANAIRPAASPANRMPAFPASELARGEKGPLTVYLHLTIDPTGAVTAATPISGREPFRTAAVEAARTWRFTPGRVDGREVTVRDFLVPVRFSVASR